MIRRFLILAAFIVNTGLSFAGGPLYVGGPTFGSEGQPLLWDLANGPVQYRTDGGPLARTSAGIVIANDAAIARVQSMFQVWQDVPTSDVAFSRAGGLLAVGGFSDGDVNTVTEFDTVTGQCDDAGPVAQTAIIFDADGSLFLALIGDPFVIGVTFACQLGSDGHIRSAISVLNGRFQDGINDAGSTNNNFELTAAEFDQAFTHEFGHLIGMDHAQSNVEVLDLPFPCSDDDVRGLPIMFPFLACQARVSAGLPPLAPDDIAWVSKLYPSSSFASTYGTLRGTVYFSDGQSGAQGVNVIARPIDDPLTPEDESRTATYTVVSGFLFTANPGQSVTGTNTGGSDLGSRIGNRIGHFEMALPPGDYILEVESVDFAFVGGSSVGPFFAPIPNPGVNEFWDDAESYFDDPAAATTINISAGATVTRDVVLNGTPQRLDNFEDEAFALPDASRAMTILRSGR
jgi:hypothetical protein